MVGALLPVSVLFNEPKLLKCTATRLRIPACVLVSVLFNEPKLLKSSGCYICFSKTTGFSALQRAEIAEIAALQRAGVSRERFSALQRAEIAEIAGAGGGSRVERKFQCSSTSRNC